jgi:hypothetical protein
MAVEHSCSAERCCRIVTEEHERRHPPASPGRVRVARVGGYRDGPCIGFSWILATYLASCCAQGSLIEPHVDKVEAVKWLGCRSHPLIRA